MDTLDAAGEAARAGAAAGTLAGNEERARAALPSCSTMATAAMCLHRPSRGNAGQVHSLSSEPYR